MGSPGTMKRALALCLWAGLAAIACRGGGGSPSDAGPDGGSDTDTDVDADVDGDADADTDSDVDSDTDADTDADIDGGADAGSDAGTDTGSDTEDGEYEIVGTVTLPEGFAASPKAIQFLYYDAAGGFPPALGIPDGFGDLIPDVVIGPSAPLAFSVCAHDYAGEPLGDGDYYLAAVLYVEGGSTPGAMPTAGVDWVGASNTIVALPAASEIDVGSFELSLYATSK